jgi:hypothetical protein
MKSSPRPAKSRTNAARRARLLASFDRSGLSAAAFARQHGLTYTTFCSWTRERRLRSVQTGTTGDLSRVWRHQRAKTKPSPQFVQVELPAAPAPVELLIELGAPARLRLTSTGQLDLAARLIQALNPATPC